MITSVDLELAYPHARILWAYNQMHQAPRDADILLVMGTNDVRVADHAAILAQQFKYTYIVCSGGVAHEHSMLKTGFGDSEANIFAARMIAHGVPDDRILREQLATNTGQNVICTRDLLHNLGADIRTGQLVQKPFMERRALATAQKQWPEIRWSVSSQGGTFDDFVVGTDAIKVIHVLVGDTYRVLSYAQNGFQVPQEMPDSVRAALCALIDLGFNQHLPERLIDI